MDVVVLSLTLLSPLRAFLNCARGDQGLFVGASELIEAWRIFTPLLHEIDAEQDPPNRYLFGTRGPTNAMDAFYKGLGLNTKRTWEEWILDQASDVTRLKSLFLDLAGAGPSDHADTVFLDLQHLEGLLRRFNDGRSPSPHQLDRLLRRLDKNADCKVAWPEVSNASIYFAFAFAFQLDGSVTLCNLVPRGYHRNYG